MTTTHDGDDPRYEALAHGLDTLDDRALVGVLLGRAVGGRSIESVAAQLLETAGGVSGLARCGLAVLAAQPGVGTARALRLGAAIEVGRRLATRAPTPSEPLDNPSRVAQFLAPRLGALLHEEMWVLSLDGANRLRGVRRVAQGGLHGMSIAPGDILRAALWDGGTGFILAHNHPSGQLEPSREDLETTVRIAVSAHQLGVPLLDHVIVTPTGDFLSMAELGALHGSSEPLRARKRRRDQA